MILDTRSYTEQLQAVMLRLTLLSAHKLHVAFVHCTDGEASGGGTTVLVMQAKWYMSTYIYNKSLLWLMFCYTKPMRKGYKRTCLCQQATPTNNALGSLAQYCIVVVLMRSKHSVLHPVPPTVTVGQSATAAEHVDVSLIHFGDMFYQHLWLLAQTRAAAGMESHTTQPHIGLGRVAVQLQKWAPKTPHNLPGNLARLCCDLGQGE